MGTMTKWPVHKHTEHHKTRSKQRRNRHKEITIFCVFRFFWFLFSIFNYPKDFSRKCWITALVRSIKVSFITRYSEKYTTICVIVKMSLLHWRWHCVPACFNNYVVTFSNQSGKYVKFSNDIAWLFPHAWTCWRFNLRNRKRCWLRFDINVIHIHGQCCRLWAYLQHMSTPHSDQHIRSTVSSS